MNPLRVKSPTRIDLAGGFLDIWPVYALLNHCCVVNCSIPLFTSVSLQFRKTKEIDIEIHWPSGLYKKSFSCLRDVFAESAQEVALLREHFRYWSTGSDCLKGGFSICLKSQSPIGAGLGGSSSLGVSLVKLFSLIRKKEFPSREVVFLCRDLETAVLHKPAGIQDYIPALGEKIFILYMVRLSAFGPEWTEKQVPKDFFKHHILLLDLGQPHHSGNNNWNILKKVIEKDENILRGLYRLRDNALKVAEFCERGEWIDGFQCIQKDHDLRSEFFPGWLTPSVSKVSQLLIDEGAQSLKLCGAGGGGCLMVMTKDLKSKKHLQQVCVKHQISTIQIE